MRFCEQHQSDKGQNPWNHEDTTYVAFTGKLYVQGWF